MKNLISILTFIAVMAIIALCLPTIVSVVWALIVAILNVVICLYAAYLCVRIVFLLLEGLGIIASRADSNNSKAWAY